MMDVNEPLDVMGYPLKPILSQYTEEEIAAARAMARDDGYKWDCVGTDPRVTGKRFLKLARLALKAARQTPKSLDTQNEKN